MMESVSCTTISGYAYIAGNPPQGSVTVAFFSDNNSPSGQFGTAVANLYRADIQGTVGGSGLYGFNFPTPASLMDNATHQITAKVVGGTSIASPAGNAYGYAIRCAPAAPYYTYTENVTTSPAPADAGNWTANGSITSAYPGGSYLWNQTPSGWGAEYEIRTEISLNPNYQNTGGGVFQHYLRAQSNALSGSGGNALLVELQQPMFSSLGNCTAVLAMYEVVGGNATQTFGAVVGCGATTTMRTVVYGNTVATMINGVSNQVATSFTAGAPGYGAYGVPSWNGISSVAIGPRNTAAPNPIPAQSIASSPFADHVDVRWQDPVDTTGVGIIFY
jgi:hypothetical protein